MNEITLSNDLNVITAEINSHKQVAGQAIFEIGKRLKHVKENDLVHGEWKTWCNEKLNMSPQYANRYIKVSDELDANGKSSFDLGVDALYQIATMPEQERDVQHEIPSTGESKKVDEMTVKELREVKKQLKQTEQDNQRLGQQLTEERNKEPKIIEKLVKIDNTDYSLQNKIDKLQERYESSERERQSLEEKVGTATEDSEQYEKMKSDLNRLHEEKDDIYRQIESATSISALYVDIEHLLQEKLAPIKYSRALTESKDSKVAMKNLKEIIEMVDNWSQEMKTYLPQSNIIDAEYTTVDSK